MSRNKDPLGRQVLAAVQAKNFGRAVDLSHQLIQRYPRSAASQLRARRRPLGHTSEFLRAITRAADLSPDSAYMLATVGYTYINLNCIPDAIPPLQRAAHLAPNDHLVQSQLRFCLEETGQTEAAIEHLRRGSKLAPAYAPVWEHLGLA